MSDHECFNEEWAAENDHDVEWARSMWWCDCPVCVAWPEPVEAVS